MADYYDGAATLTATPALGSVFTGWSGSAKCYGGALVNPCAWLMADEDATLIATFELEEEAPLKGGPPEEGGGEEQKGAPVTPPAAQPSPGPPAPPKVAKCGKRKHRPGAQRAKPCKRVKHGKKRHSQHG